ncbi:NlpC/P60 family protein [Geomonas sp. Red32]|uniref:C40 family peptidase n=1 Tax=Geomonas sp. Red32 TaxID=2912856 RepID=UPI00202CF1E8|nr:NlpC/P60 family protein [Geomonas sp. Red32]
MFHLPNTQRRRLFRPLALLLFSLLLLFAATLFAGEPPRYVVAISPAPVLKTPDFPKVFGGSNKLDPCQGVRPIEFVALPGTLFRVEGVQRVGGVVVYRVTTNDYPYPAKSGYFVDARFVAEPEGTPVERPRALPPLAEVQKRLMAALGKPYVWGGNVRDGIPLLKELYPKGDPLAGVDCSGLLYQATGGFTPRNTSALTSFGKGVPVAGLTVDEIADRLEPLDLIVWKGHVMVVLDGDSVIQSTMGCRGVGGVHISGRRETIRRLVKVRKPADTLEGSGKGKSFVIRRWFRR